VESLHEVFFYLWVCFTFEQLSTFSEEASRYLYCKERYKEGLLWAGRGMIPVNELAWPQSSPKPEVDWGRVIWHLRGEHLSLAVQRGWWSPALQVSSLVLLPAWSRPEPLQPALGSVVGLRRQYFPTLDTHVINAAAALAGDDYPGQQCTGLII